MLSVDSGSTQDVISEKSVKAPETLSEVFVSAAARQKAD